MKLPPSFLIATFCAENLFVQSNTTYSRQGVSASTAQSLLTHVCSISIDKLLHAQTFLTPWLPEPFELTPFLCAGEQLAFAPCATSSTAGSLISWNNYLYESSENEC